MSNDNLKAKVTKIIEETLEGFSNFYPSGFREQNLYILDVNAMAECAGRFERKEDQNGQMINRIYFIGSQEDELNSLISIASEDSANVEKELISQHKRKVYIAHLALIRIYEDVVTLKLPLPIPLANYILSYVDNGKAAPTVSQSMKNEFRNFVVRHLALAAKETGYTKSTTKNRESESIVGIISSALKGQAGSPDSVLKIANEELKKKADKSLEK